jgi:cobalt-zinc-cadmium efflux system protein
MQLYAYICLMGAGHDHSHGGDTRVSRMVIAAAVLSVFFVIELTTAILINSIALLADAGHMLTDLVAMFMGLTAVLLARHGPASAARTYGWHRAEVFTAVANAVLLLGVAVFILYEAFERLGNAPEVPGVPMIVVALAGLLANAIVVVLLRSDSEKSLAVKGAYMEVVADTVGSLGVLIAGIVTVTTHWPYADVVVAVLVALWVLPRAVSLARAALRILSESSPRHIDVEELRAALTAVAGVTEVHDLHVWTLVPGKDMATAHLTANADSARVLADARAVLAARGVAHATVQVEPEGCDDCGVS